jgi:uncharacterized protein (TIGR03435 family)
MAERVLQNLTIVRKLLLFGAGIATVAGSSLFGQQNIAPANPAYEVVSVRPSKPGNGMSVGHTPIGFTARNTTAWGLIFNAYKVWPNNPIQGLPGWAETAQFDLEAKMDDDTAAALQKLPREQQEKQRILMLQLVLADRFKLRVHYETKERPIYALLVAKGGFKGSESPATEAEGGSSWGNGLITFKRMPIGDLAFFLSDVLGRAVVDKTGLAGKYDLALKWTPEERQTEPDAGPPLFTAIQEQLGLKLESTKGPVDLLVVDHIERPSDN